jgi:PTS system fructose-specific IIA component/PTS system nitrogen regulatory IIA component
MKFSDFISVASIRADVAADEKPDVLRELVSSLAAAGAVKQADVDGIVAAIMKREELGSTGIGRGVAVPHT